MMSIIPFQPRSPVKAAQPSPRHIFTICFFIASVLFSPIQDAVQAQATLAQDSLTVRVNNVVIENDEPFRGLVANFPNPVISSVSILDRNGLPVLGLADTTDWLGPNDVAQIGLPISEIWQKVIEYHRDDPSIPADNDVYNQIPEPLFTEVRETTELRTSTMLIMDISSSMTEEIENAKLGARAFVELMRPSDYVGLIQFADVIRAYQPLTNNQDSLQQLIDTTQLGNGTALRDAIFEGINQLKTAPGRRGIIVYTDGRDNASTVGPRSVIDAAQAANIPIFTISLGQETSEDRLKEYASETGGLFFKVADASEMVIIYQRLSDLFRNYYLIAHTSPDPVRNDTWRVVDITVNDGTLPGHSSGVYFVGALPPPPPTDLSVNLTAQSDTTIFIDGAPVPAVKPGEIFQYNIRVRNLGPDSANTVDLVQVLPSSVFFVDSSVEPASVADDIFVRWQLQKILVGTDTTITATVVYEPPAETDELELLSRITLGAANDSNDENNVDSTSVRVLLPPPPPPPPTDVVISLSSQSDSTAIVNDETYTAILPGEQYTYSIVVSNIGPEKADSLNVSQTLPDSVQFIDASIAPVSTSGKFISWEFTEMAAGRDTAITVQAEYIGQGSLLFLPSSANVLAKNDTLLFNNGDSDSVFVVQPPPPPPAPTDLSVDITSHTDSIVIVDGVTYSAAQFGEIFNYVIRVQNLGPAESVETMLHHELPDSVSFISASLSPTNVGEKDLDWQLADISAGAETGISVSVQLSINGAGLQRFLPSLATIAAANDSVAENNSDIDSVRVLLPPPPPPGKFDLQISQTVVTDTTIQLNGEVVPAVLAGGEYAYELQIENLGPSTAYNITIQDLLPSAVSGFDFDLQPSEQAGDSLTWFLDSLLVGEQAEIAFSARVSETLPEPVFALTNIATVIAELDSNQTNDSTVTTVFAVSIPDTSLQRTDIALSHLVRTDSFSVSAGDTTWFARRGETYDYTITVSNIGDHSALAVLVENILPDSVTASGFSVTPARASDTLRWSLGALTAGGTATLTFDATVAQIMPIGRNFLINEVTVSALNELPDSQLDNSATTTVVNLSRPAGGTRPLIQAEPTVVDVGDSVLVRVQARVTTLRWDVWVRFANGEIDSSYADAFIATTPLGPVNWLEIRPRFGNTRLFTDAEEEALVFELRTLDIFGDEFAVQANVTVRSNNNLVLERNVFVASTEDLLGINFKLSSNRVARLDLFDLSGSHIAKIAEGPYNAGWNTFPWNGTTQTGQVVGSGVYMITLRSAGFSAMKKVMIVR